MNPVMPRASSRNPPAARGRGGIVKRSNDTTAKTKRRRTGEPSSTQEGAASSFATTPPLSDNEDRRHHSENDDHDMKPSQSTQTQTGNSQGSSTTGIERASYEWVTSLNMKVWKGWHQVHVVPYRRLREDGRTEDVYPSVEGYPNTVGKFWSMKNTAEGRKLILALLSFYSYSGWRTWHEPEYPEELGAVRTRPFPSLEAAAQTYPERAHEALGQVLHLDFTRISDASLARRLSRGNLIRPPPVPQQRQQPLLQGQTPNSAERKRKLEEAAQIPANVTVTEGGKTRVMSNMSMLNLQLENWEWQERKHKEKRAKAISKIKDNLSNFSPPSRPLREPASRKSPIDGGPPSSQRHAVLPDEGISTATTMLQKDIDDKSIMETSQLEHEDGDDESEDDDIGGTQILTDELPSQKNGLLPPSAAGFAPMQGVLGSPFAPGQEFQVGGNGFVVDPMNISGRYNKYRAKDPEEEVYESESTDADEEIVCPKTC